MNRYFPFASLAVKILVSLGLLFFLLTRVDLSRLLGVITSARPSYLLVALTGYFLGQIISSLRWTLLARPLGFDNPFKDFAIFYFIGMFFNLFAPSTVGGDIGKVFYLARATAQPRQGRWGARTAHALLSVLADRAVGMAVLVWMGAVALWAFPAYALPAAVRYPTYAIAVVTVLGWLLLPLLNRFLRSERDSLRRSLHQGLETYWNRQQVIVQTIFLSLMVHGVQAWMQIVLGRALDLEIPWSYCFILYPLVGVFSALPISFNGIGLRESGYLFLLRQIDVSSEKAVAFGLLWFVIVALDSLLGGVVFVLKKVPKPSASLSEMTD